MSKEINNFTYTDELTNYLSKKLLEQDKLDTDSEVKSEELPTIKDVPDFESDMLEMDKAAVNFLLKNPRPDDDDVHYYCREKALDYEEFEKALFKLAGRFIGFLYKEGLSNRGTINVHPDELLRGIEVEKEHTDDPVVSKKIAMDHLAEIPDYYTRLDAMEAQAEEDAKSTPGDEEVSREDQGGLNVVDTKIPRPDTPEERREI